MCSVVSQQQIHRLHRSYLQDVQPVRSRLEVVCSLLYSSKGRQIELQEADPTVWYSLLDIFYRSFCLCRRSCRKKDLLRVMLR